MTAIIHIKDRDTVETLPCHHVVVTKTFIAIYYNKDVVDCYLPLSHYRLAGTTY